MESPGIFHLAVFLALAGFIEANNGVPVFVFGSQRLEKLSLDKYDSWILFPLTTALITLGVVQTRLTLLQFTLLFSLQITVYTYLVLHF